MGLQRLFLRTSPQGESQIIAGASPDEAIVTLAASVDPEVNVIVTLRAQLELNLPQPSAGNNQPTPLPPLAYESRRAYEDEPSVRQIETNFDPARQYHGSPVAAFPREGVVTPRVTGTSRSRVQIPRSGGALVQPQPGSNTVTVVTWNTSNSLGRGTNPSHAEYHFRDWLIGRPIEWRRRIAGINVHLSHSPCSGCREQTCGNCTSLLCEIVSSILPNVQDDKRILNWDELFQGQGATQIPDLASLRRCHWNISGPIQTGRVPQGTQRELKRLNLL
jgi:hypothetical protein